jgi:hypothetical protein
VHGPNLQYADLHEWSVRQHPDHQSAGDGLRQHQPDLLRGIVQEHPDRQSELRRVRHRLPAQYDLH